MTIRAHRRSVRRAAAVAALALAVVPLAACGDSDDDVTTTEAAAAETTEATSATLVVEDAWVKATTEQQTGAFGILRNDSDTDIVVVGATTSVAPTVELHETVASADGSMKMQPKEGGFTVPAGGELTLQPGGDHIMLIDLTAPITAGEEVTIALELEGGGTVEFTATAKDFTGANETYEGGHGGAGSGNGMRGGMGETTTTAGMG
jgi:copper(I)-binding protein